MDTLGNAFVVETETLKPIAKIRIPKSASQAQEVFFGKDKIIFGHFIAKGRTPVVRVWNWKKSKKLSEYLVRGAGRSKELFLQANRDRNLILTRAEGGRYIHLLDFDTGRDVVNELPNGFSTDNLHLSPSGNILVGLSPSNIVPEPNTVLNRDREAGRVWSVKNFDVNKYIELENFLEMPAVKSVIFTKNERFWLY
jgi:hypothetical protein